MKIYFYLILATFCINTHNFIIASQAPAPAKKYIGPARKPINPALDAAFYKALHANDLPKIKALLSGATIPNISIKYVSGGDTPLIWKSAENEPEAKMIVEELLAAGADVNERGRDERTALMLAIDYNNPATVQLLLAHGADINARLEGGRTLLMDYAAQPEIKYLPKITRTIAAGADQTIRNEQENNMTAAEYAWSRAAYDAAVAAGLKEFEDRRREQEAYRARQAQAKEIIATEGHFLPDLNKIVVDYAYGPSLEDLPATKEEQKEAADNCKLLK